MIKQIDELVKKLVSEYLVFKESGASPSEVSVIFREAENYGGLDVRIVVGEKLGEETLED